MATNNPNSQDPTSSKESMATNAAVRDGLWTRLPPQRKAKKPTRLVLSQKNRAVLRPLLDAGQSEVALAIAIRHLMKADSLCRRHTQSGGTPLHFAAVDNDYPLATELLDFGFDCNPLDRSLSTPLSLAAVFGSINVARVLLERGASLDAANYWGNTALHMAVLGSFENMCEQLIKAGAAIDVRNNDGETPLMLAVSMGRATVAQVLVRFGADVHLVLTADPNTRGVASKTSLEIRGMLETGVLSQRHCEAGSHASRQSI